MNLSLAQKGLIVVGMPLILSLTDLGILFWVNHETQQTAAREERSRHASECAMMIVMKLMRAGKTIALYSMMNERRYGDRYDEFAHEIAHDIDELRQTISGNQSQERNVQRIRECSDKFVAMCNQMKSTIDRGDRISSFLSSRRLLSDVLGLMKELEHELYEFMDEETNYRIAPTAALEKTRTLPQIIIAIAAVLNVILTLFIAKLFYSGITARLRILTDNTFRLARADTLNPPIGGGDEIAHLDRVFHDMANALAEAARKERAIIENALDVICSMDAEGRFTAVSPASLEVWGYTPDELIARNYTEIIHPADVQATLDSAADIMAERSIAPFESRAIKRDGEVVHIRWSAYWSPTERSLFCVAHDITERKRQEDRIKASEARVRAIIETMPVGLLVLDFDGRIEQSNPHVFRIFGYQPERLVGQHISMLFPREATFEERNFTPDNLQKLIEHVREFEGQRLSGECFPAEFTLQLHRMDEGPRLLAIMMDESERHEVERLKREFVSTVSHELRTPLTAIRGSLTLLAVGAMGSLSEQADKVVRIAERNSIRLINLINDLLDIEKLEAGKLDMAYADTHIFQVVERSVESVRAFADPFGISVVAPTGDWLVYADGDRLVQVLVNLLSNAIKYSPRDGTVTVTAETNEDSLEVCVNDQGRGIPAEMIDKVFERFQQVETADAKHKGGTGLGLAICRAIVEQHDGQIGVRSELGKGSTFWFKIPLAGTAAAASLARRKARPEVLTVIAGPPVADNAQPDTPATDSAHASDEAVLRLNIKPRKHQAALIEGQTGKTGKSGGKEGG